MYGKFLIWKMYDEFELLKIKSVFVSELNTHESKKIIGNFSICFNTKSFSFVTKGNLSPESVLKSPMSDYNGCNFYFVNTIVFRLKKGEREKRERKYFHFKFSSKIVALCSRTLSYYRLDWMGKCWTFYSPTISIYRIPVQYPHTFILPNPHPPRQFNRVTQLKYQFAWSHFAIERELRTFCGSSASTSTPDQFQSSPKCKMRLCRRWQNHTCSNA